MSDPPSTGKGGGQESSKRRGQRSDESPSSPFFLERLSYPIAGEATLSISALPDSSEPGGAASAELPSSLESPPKASVQTAAQLQEAHRQIHQARRSLHEVAQAAAKQMQEICDEEAVMQLALTVFMLETET